MITQVALTVRWLDDHRNAYTDGDPLNNFRNCLVWHMREWIIDETFREANRRNAEAAKNHMARHRVR